MARRAKAKKAESVEERLQQLYEMHGRLTPDLVIEDARNQDSILHSHFNWDVEAAALEHWRDRARQLIRSVRVVFTTDTTAVASVAYVRDPSCAPGEQGYVQVTKVRTETDRARQVLVDEFSRAASALTRARELAAVFGMQDDVDELIEGVHATQQRVPEQQRM